MIPQLIFLMLLFWGTGFHIAKHGEAKDGKYNLWGAFLNDFIVLGLLYWGGFFDSFFTGAP